MKKKKVLILCGGRSNEHEVSLVSAKHVIEALDRKRFTPLVVGIDKDGTWYLQEEAGFFKGEVRADRISLNTEAPTVTIQPFSDKSGVGHLYCGDTLYPFDVVFPVVHGPYGEDGTLQGMLEMLNTPYVGAGCASSAVCMDKELTKMLCRLHDLPSADFTVLRQQEDVERLEKSLKKLGTPLFVKPSRMGSSVGITKVTAWDDLADAVALALKYDTKCIVEQAIEGREIETAVLGIRGNTRVAKPAEILPDPKIGFYSYEGKYVLEDGAKLVAPAQLEPKLAKQIQSFALRAFDIFECEGMARVDLFVSPKGTVYLNELNTIPGFTPISLYPRMWQTSGLDYPELLTELIDLAFRRHKRA